VYLTTVRKGILLTHKGLATALKILFFLQLIAAQVGMTTQQRATAGLPGLCENFRPIASNI